jgi:hypothetical protein
MMHMITMGKRVSVDRGQSMARSIKPKRTDEAHRGSPGPAQSSDKSGTVGRNFQNQHAFGNAQGPRLLGPQVRYAQDGSDHAAVPDQGFHNHLDLVDRYGKANPGRRPARRINGRVHTNEFATAVQQGTTGISERAQNISEQPVSSVRTDHLHSLHRIENWIYVAMTLHDYSPRIDRRVGLEDIGNGPANG